MPSVFVRPVHWTLCAALSLLALPAYGTNTGFQLNHYEDTPAGDPFLAVEDPWYSSTRYFAAGLTFDYAHNLLSTSVYQNNSFGPLSAVTNNQLQGHLDLAGSLFGRVALSFSLPFVLTEGGHAVNVETSSGVQRVGPASASVEDPRIGLRFRLFGETDRDPLAMSLGADLWIPIGANVRNEGDASARVMPRLTLGGVVLDRLRYSVNAGFLYRPLAQLVPGAGNGVGNTVGSEIQLGAAVHAMFLDQTFSFGPEVVVDQAVGPRPSQQSSPYSELFGTVNYLIGRVVLVQAGVGAGLSGVPGPPEVRGLLRISFSPTPEPPPRIEREGEGHALHSTSGDMDSDGILDANDVCPAVPSGAHPDPKRLGCPAGDADGDGVFDSEDMCPTAPAGAHPDAKRPGCPAGDADGDGVFDSDDQCPTIPEGANPDLKHRGCPLKDTDGDGVFDAEDVCPTIPQGARPDPKRPGCSAADTDNDGVEDYEDVCPALAAGPHPDPSRKGCPANDNDNDGVLDHEDLCPTVPKGLHPDPARNGCPLPDKDGDSIPDVNDACPEQAGAPDPDPKKNGCPGLVIIQRTEIKIMEQVFFDKNKATIQKRSYPLLNAVLYAIQSTPLLKRISVDGHSDNKGSTEANMRLSQKRAEAVMQYLVEHGIDPSRLEAHGYGPTQPIADNNTEEGRALNRRVQFKILDPAPASAK